MTSVAEQRMIAQAEEFLRQQWAVQHPPVVPPANRSGRPTRKPRWWWAHRSTAAVWTLRVGIPIELAVIAVTIWLICRGHA